MLEVATRRLMRLHLTEFDATEVYGIYGSSKDALATRMRFLHPAAAKSFRAMSADSRVRCSDMLRTPEGSLSNRRRKGKGLRPGWSGHNYGFSIDIVVGWMLKTHGINKMELDQWMASHGWYCHNIPGETRSYEAWHYNYFGEEAEHYLSFREDSSKRTWSSPISQKIEEYYGHWWQRTDIVSVQRALKNLKFYEGGLDVYATSPTKTALRSFQKEWDLAVDGIAGPNTLRTLMLVSAEKVLVDEVC